MDEGERGVGVSKVMKRAIEVRAPQRQTLARELGVSPETLIAWRAERREPTKANLMKMADLLVDASAELRALAVELREEARLPKAERQRGAGPV